MNLILLKLINIKSLQEIIIKIIKSKMNHKQINIRNKLKSNNISSINPIPLFCIQD